MLLVNATLSILLLVLFITTGGILSFVVCVHAIVSLISCLGSKFEFTSAFQVRVKWNKGTFEIHVHNFELKSAAHDVVSRAISFHLPLKCEHVGFSHAVFSWSGIREKKTLIPSARIKKALIIFTVTSDIDWNSHQSHYESIARRQKHQMVNYLTSMVEGCLGNHSKPVLSWTVLLKDYVISNLTIFTEQFELRLRIPAQNSALGVMWQSLLLYPISSPSLPMPWISLPDVVVSQWRDMQWGVTSSNFRLYLDPSASYFPSRNSVDSRQHDALHDFILLANELEMRLTLPFIFVALFQPGRQPWGHIRRISFSGDVNGVIIAFHESQMSSFLHVVIPSLWRDYKTWKLSLCDQYHLSSITPSRDEATEYVELYASIRRIERVDKYSLARIQELERPWTMAAIMSMRSVASCWDMAKLATMIPANPVPAQVYPTYEDISFDSEGMPCFLCKNNCTCHWRNEILSKFIKWRRPYYDDENTIIRDIVLSPLCALNVQIPIVSNAEETPSCSAEDCASSICSCFDCGNKFSSYSLHHLFPLRGGCLQSSLQAEIGFAHVMYLLGRKHSSANGTAYREAAGASDIVCEPSYSQLEASLAASNFHIEWNQQPVNEFNYGNSFASMRQEHKHVVIESSEGSGRTASDFDTQSFHFLVEYKSGTEGSAAYRIDSQSLTINALYAIEVKNIVDLFLASLRRQTPQKETILPTLLTSCTETSPYLESPAQVSGWRSESSNYDDNNEEKEDFSKNVELLKGNLFLSNRLLSVFFRFSKIDIIFPEAAILTSSHRREHKTSAVLVRSSTELVILSGDGAENIWLTCNCFQMCIGSICFIIDQERSFGLYHWKYSDQCNYSRYLESYDANHSLQSEESARGNDLTGVYVEHLQLQYNATLRELSFAHWSRQRCEELLQGAFGSKHVFRLWYQVLSVSLRDEDSLESNQTFVPVCVVPVLCTRAICIKDMRVLDEDVASPLLQSCAASNRNTRQPIFRSSEQPNAAFGGHYLVECPESSFDCCNGFQTCNCRFGVEYRLYDALLDASSSIFGCNETVAFPERFDEMRFVGEAASFGGDLKDGCFEAESVPIIGEGGSNQGTLRTRLEASLPLVGLRISSLEGFASYKHTHLSAILLRGLHITVGASVPHFKSSTERYLVQCATAKNFDGLNDGGIAFGEILYIPYHPMCITEGASSSSPRDLKLDFVLKCVLDIDDDSDDLSVKNERVMGSAKLMFPHSTEVSTSFERKVAIHDVNNICVGELDVTVGWIQGLSSENVKSELQGGMQLLNSGHSVSESNVHSVDESSRALNAFVGQVSLGICPTDLKVFLQILNKFSEIFSSMPSPANADITKSYGDGSPTLPRSNLFFADGKPEFDKSNDDAALDAQGGMLTLLLGDLNSREFTDAVLKRYPSIGIMLSSSGVTLNDSMETFWSIISKHTALEKRQRNSSSGDAFLTPQHNAIYPEKEIFNVAAAKKFQKELVLLFHDYAFACEAWGLIVVPQWLRIPIIGKVSVKRNIRINATKHGTYVPMASPVSIGSKVFVDSNATIASFENAHLLSKVPLTGLRTATEDRRFASNKSISFEVSSECTLFLCWDIRAFKTGADSSLNFQEDSLPQWVKRRGFRLTNMVIKTSNTSHAVLSKRIEATGSGWNKIVLGGCGISRRTEPADNYFILASPPCFANGLSETKDDVMVSSNRFADPTPTKSVRHSAASDILNPFQDMLYTGKSPKRSKNEWKDCFCFDIGRFAFRSFDVNLYRWHLSKDSPIDDEDGNDDVTHLNDSMFDGFSSSTDPNDEVVIRSPESLQSRVYARTISINMKIPCFRMFCSNAFTERSRSREESGRSADIVICSRHFELRMIASSNDNSSKIRLLEPSPEMPFWDEISGGVSSEVDVKIIPFMALTTSTQYPKGGVTESSRPVPPLAQQYVSLLDSSSWSLSCERSAGSSAITVEGCCEDQVAVNLAPSIALSLLQLLEDLSPQSKSDSQSPRKHSKLGTAASSEDRTRAEDKIYVHKPMIIRTDTPNIENVSNSNSVSNGSEISMIIIKNCLGQSMHFELCHETSSEEVFNEGNLAFDIGNSTAEESVNPLQSRDQYSCFCRIPADSSALVKPRDAGCSAEDLAVCRFGVHMRGWSDIKRAELPIPTQIKEANGDIHWTSNEGLYRIHKCAVQCNQLIKRPSLTQQNELNVRKSLSFDTEESEEEGDDDSDGFETWRSVDEIEQNVPFSSLPKCFPRHQRSFAVGNDKAPDKITCDDDIDDLSSYNMSSTVSFSEMLQTPFKRLKLKFLSELVKGRSSQSHEQMREEYSLEDSPFALHVVTSVIPATRVQSDASLISIVTSNRVSSEGISVSTTSQWALEISISTNISFDNATGSTVRLGGRSAPSDPSERGGAVEGVQEVEDGDSIPLTLSVLHQGNLYLQKSLDGRDSRGNFSKPESISLLQRFFNPTLPTRLRTSDMYDMQSLSVDFKQGAPEMSKHSPIETGKASTDRRALLHWNISMAPAMIFVNALPCTILLQVVQVPYLVSDSYQSSSKNSVGAESLLFFPGGYSDYDGSCKTAYNVDPTREHSGISSLRSNFENNANAVMCLAPGETFPVSTLQLSEAVSFRIQLQSFASQRGNAKPLWSRPKYVCPPGIHFKRGAFQKHIGEKLEWEYSTLTDLSAFRAPEGIKYQRVWRRSREVVFYADFWLINKSGLDLQYHVEYAEEAKEKSSQSKESALLSFCKSEYSDHLHDSLFGKGSHEIPVLLSCPNRLKILPLGLASTNRRLDNSGSSGLYIYDFFSSTGRQYHSISVLNICPSFEMGPGASGLSDCPVYSDESWHFSFSSWPASLSSLLSTEEQSSATGVYIQPPNADRYSETHHTSQSSFQSQRHTFLSFQVSVPCFVFVGLDARGSVLPLWLLQLGFAPTGERVRTSDTSTLYSLYKKFYNAGDRVRLGSSRVKASKGKTVNMYLLFVISSPVGYIEPTVGQIARSPSHSVWTSAVRQASKCVKRTVATVTRRRHHSRRVCYLKCGFRKGDCVFAEDQVHVNSLRSSHGKKHRIGYEPVTAVVLPRLLSRLSLLALQTNNADRFVSAHHVSHLTLELLHPTHIFLCLDMRIPQANIPDWVHSTGFIDSTLKLQSSASFKPDADLQEGVFRIFHRSIGTDVCRLGGLGATGYDYFNYFVLLADERAFLQELSFFPYNSIPGQTSEQAKEDQSGHHSHSLGEVEGDEDDCCTVTSIRDFWSENSTMTSQNPFFNQQGRNWSSYFDARNKGEVMTSSVSLSLAPVTHLPGIFNRTKAITFLPRFTVVNNLSFSIRLLPQRGVFELVKQSLPRRLQPGQRCLVPSPLDYDVNAKSTMKLSPGQSCIVYSFEDATAGCAPLYPGARGDEEGREIRRWVRVASESADHFCSTIKSTRDGLRDKCQSCYLNSKDFSSPVSMDDVGDSYIWLPEKDSGGSCLASPTFRSHRRHSSAQSPGTIASASVMLIENSVVLTLNDSSYSPPYRLENRTTNTVFWVRQKLSEKFHKKRGNRLDPTNYKASISIANIKSCDSEDRPRSAMEDDNCFRLSSDSADIHVECDSSTRYTDKTAEFESDSDQSWHMIPPRSWKSYIWEDPQSDKYLEVAVDSTIGDGSLNPKLTVLSESIRLDEIGPIQSFEFESNAHLSGVSRRTIGGHIFADGSTRVLVLHETANTPILSRQLSFSLHSSPVKVRRSSWKLPAKASGQPSREKKKKRPRVLARVQRQSEKRTSRSTSLLHHLLDALECRFSLPCLQLNICVESDFQSEESVSVLNELLCCTMEGFALQMCGKDSESVLSIETERDLMFMNRKQCDVYISHLQVDDMRVNARFPVVFSPCIDSLEPQASSSNEPLWKSSIRRLSPPKTPHVHTRCTWVYGSACSARSDDSRSVECNTSNLIHIQDLEVVAREMNVKVDLDLILDVIKHIGLVTHELASRQTRQRLHVDRFFDSPSVQSRDAYAAILSKQAVDTVFSQSLNDAVSTATSVAAQKKAIYIELFHHSSLTLNIEIFVGRQFQHLDLTQQLLLESSSSTSSAVALGFAVVGTPLLSVLSQLVSTISHTSPTFRFNALIVSNYFGSASALVQILMGSFQRQLLRQIYKVLGSMEVLGDPLELVENLGTGVADFFSHTKAEMIGRADTRGEGVRRLAQAVVGGAFGSAAKMSGSLVDMVRQVAGSGLGGVVVAPLTGALGAVSVVTESVSQSTRRPTVLAQRKRVPRLLRNTSNEESQAGSKHKKNSDPTN